MARVARISRQLFSQALLATRSNETLRAFEQLAVGSQQRLAHTGIRRLAVSGVGAGIVMGFTAAGAAMATLAPAAAAEVSTRLNKRCLKSRPAPRVD